MLAEFFATATGFISSHPHLAGFVIFIATAAEAIAVLGSVFPGATIVLAVAGLAGAAGENVGSLLIWCAAGAIVGDGVSYWLGSHYGEHLKSIWPFSRHPELLRRGADFFEKHGGKSVVIGRFLPVTRAVVPVVAGMLAMPPVRFYTANVISAFAWAASHILPAAGVGFALAVLNNVSSRLVVLIASAAVLAFLGILLAKWTIRRLVPTAFAGYAVAIGWLGKRPYPIARRAARLLDPEKPKLSAFAIWIAVLVLGSTGFVWIIESLATGEPLVQADISINRLIQSLRVSAVDHLMVFVTSYGDALVIFGSVSILLIGLSLCRSWRILALVLSAVASTVVFVPTMKLALHRSRPMEIYAGADAFSFPSGHTAFVTVLVGIIAVLASRSLKMTTTVVVWATAFCVVIILGLSRVYLAAHWPSDVVGGMLFGLAVTALFALVTEHLPEWSSRISMVALAGILGFISIGSIHAVSAFDQNLERYAAKSPPVEMPLQKWADDGWLSLTSHRIDLLGETEEPIILQLAESLIPFQESMEAKGWHRAAQPKFADILKFLPASASLHELPPLPVLHNGVLAELVMVQEDKQTDRRLVLRLWPSQVHVSSGRDIFQVFVGSVTVESVFHPFHALTMLRDRQPGTARLSQLRKTVSAAVSASPRLAMRDTSQSKTSRSNIDMILIQPILSSG